MIKNTLRGFSRTQKEEKCFEFLLGLLEGLLCGHAQTGHIKFSYFKLTKILLYRKGKNSESTKTIIIRPFRHEISQKFKPKVQMSICTLLYVQDTTVRRISRGAGKSIIVGANIHIYIYSCSQPVKTKDFKRWCGKIN